MTWSELPPGSLQSLLTGFPASVSSPSVYLQHSSQSNSHDISLPLKTLCWLFMSPRVKVKVLTMARKPVPIPRTSLPLTSDFPPYTLCFNHNRIPDCPQTSWACSFCHFTLFRLPGSSYETCAHYICVLSLTYFKSYSFNKYLLSTSGVPDTIILGIDGWIQHLSDHWWDTASFPTFASHFIAVFL